MNLRWLYLNMTAVTDAGLKQLTGLTNLNFLSLSDTKVTEAGVKELKGTLSKATINQ